MIENIKENDPAPPTPQLGIMQSNINNMGYNCSECSSLIEILSINEDNNTMKFNCINNNNHNNNIKIKEYFKKMQNYNDIKNLNEICEIHWNKKNNEYINYCFDCKLHLCKECIKSKIHQNHNKEYIFDLQPNEEELNIIKEKFEYYNNNIKKIRREKENRIKDLKNILKKDIERENKKLKTIEEKNKIKEKKELKINNQKYIEDLVEIKRKYEEEIKMRKIKYESGNSNINNKYKLISNKDKIMHNNKLKELDYFYKNKINNLSDIYNIKIDNILNIIKINEIIYNTYNICNNNYYYSLNINNIINKKYIIENKEENIIEEVKNNKMNKNILIE